MAYEPRVERVLGGGSSSPPSRGWTIRCQGHGRKESDVCWGRGYRPSIWGSPVILRLCEWLHLRNTPFSLLRRCRRWDTLLEEKFSHQPTAPQLQEGQARFRYLSKLPQKLNKCSFAKGVSKTRVESKCRVILGEDGNPSFLRGKKKEASKLGLFTAQEEPDREWQDGTSHIQLSNENVSCTSLKYSSQVWQLMLFSAL